MWVFFSLPDAPSEIPIDDNPYTFLNRTFDEHSDMWPRWGVSSQLYLSKRDDKEPRWRPLHTLSVYASIGFYTLPGVCTLLDFCTILSFCRLLGLCTPLGFCLRNGANNILPSAREPSFAPSSTLVFVQRYRNGCASLWLARSLRTCSRVWTSSGL